jgi:hypothetical protein
VAKRGGGFQPRQGRAQAVVNAVTEGDVRRSRLAGPEVVGIVVDLGVAVGRGDTHQNAITRTDVDAIRMWALVAVRPVACTGESRRSSSAITRRSSGSMRSAVRVHRVQG